MTAARGPKRTWLVCIRNRSAAAEPLSGPHPALSDRTTVTELAPRRESTVPPADPKNNRSGQLLAGRKPPSIVSVAPVIYDAPSEHKNSTPGATSSGRQVRPSGIASASCSRVIPSPARNLSSIAVSTLDAHTALTRTPLRATSSAEDHVSPTTACFDVLYTAFSGLRPVQRRVIDDRPDQRRASPQAHNADTTTCHARSRPASHQDQSGSEKSPGRCQPETGII